MNTTIEELKRGEQLPERITKILNLGYEPYAIPDNWWVGRIGKEKTLLERLCSIFILRGLRLPPRHDTGGIQTVFRARIPAPVVEKHTKAMETGLFERFVIAAPSEKVFEERKVYIDPVLVGFVRTGDQAVTLTQPSRREGTRPNFYRVALPGLSVTDGMGFLIAAWDYSGDRKT